MQLVLWRRETTINGLFGQRFRDPQVRRYGCFEVKYRAHLISQSFGSPRLYKALESLNQKLLVSCELAQSQSKRGLASVTSRLVPFTTPVRFQNEHLDVLFTCINPRDENQAQIR